MTLSTEWQNMQDEGHRVRVEVQIPKSAEPLCCPLPNMAVWNLHPRVYLALDANNEAMCPYCSTHYVTVDV